MNSNAVLCIHVNSRVVVACGMYSASADDKETMVLLVLLHDTGATLTVISNPVVDCIVCKQPDKSESEDAITTFSVGLSLKYHYIIWCR